ncbi:hypothetical protein [Nocardioides pakistanensis]
MEMTQVLESLLTAIDEVAKRTADTTGQVSSRVIADYAAAARDLAEAAAWLRVPNQAHGGNTTVSGPR